MGILDDMPTCRWETRRRPSIILDAGYVPIPTHHSRPTIETLILDGKKLRCVLGMIIALVLVSLFNFTCLLWLMCQLDWSFLNSRQSQVFRIARTIELHQQSIFQDWLYTPSVDHRSSIDVISEKQIDLYGEQSSILLDNDQILFHADRFELKNKSEVDFTDLSSFQFDRQTRVHLQRVNTQHIHHRQLHLSARHSLRVSKISQAFLYSQHISVEASRFHPRSEVRFQNTHSTGGLHMKSDAVYLDLPRFPLLNDKRRRQAGVYRLCLCNSTLLLMSCRVDQVCPRC